jgi:sulfatase maturation enzyme AslB (radical SAM superfamily)
MSLQACSHCHVESSPKKLEDVMNDETAQKCVELLQKSPSVKTVDITGIISYNISQLSSHDI